MKQIFNKLLQNYEKSDFLLQQKVKVFLTICLSMLGLLQIVLFCAVFLYKITATKILLPQVIALVIIFGALCLLVKGYFVIASHLILITGLTAAWMVMFLDPTGAITRLDTIAYVLAALTMTPLIVNEAKWPIIVYFLVNFVVLTVFVIFAGNQLNFTDTHSIDYWLDNSIAIIFIGIISYKVFSINRKALDQAAQDIRERKNAEKASATAKTFLESSLSSIPEGIFLLDENIRLSYVNPVLLKPGLVEVVRNSSENQLVWSLLCF